MEELKILIVEDDVKIYNDVYRKNIDVFNMDNHEFKIIESWIKGKDEAIAALKNPENIFDGAIVDLDLMGLGGSDTSGNEIVKEIKKNQRFPIFVITGTPHHISEELNEPNAIFNVYNRDEVDFLDTLDKFKSIKATGILNLLNRNGKIEELIQNIFWKHISTSLDNWTQDRKRNSTEKEASLLRYTILHMLEYLDESSAHPSEFYITRPVKNNLSTGDLVLMDGVRYIVLTPACDFEKRPNGKRNVRNAFLLKISELNEHFHDYEESIKGREFSNSLKNKLKDIIGNKKTYFHFIPKHNSIKAGIIDFQDKLSVAIEEMEERIEKEEIDRFATISMPFLKDLIERYSSYYARQGSPDFDADEVINSLLND
ncbi:hypothetical protein CLV98_10788 [Dyadobacter jejuensis]|uniref:Uncharacterized protein n=1 Tax=Dyadobacter jejuensis TaxID=1082580 RepID=A0A316AIB0_9BACT|nr:response regulator [Dyadobacter jejuensis]PWJ57381.1 hypothetical protein CLV98_10788 [Dyadobacter jejuensis]